MLNFLRKRFIPDNNGNSVETKPNSWTKLRKSLSLTRKKIFSNLKKFWSQNQLDTDICEKLEETLIMADCGHEATQEILSQIRSAYNKNSTLTIHELLREIILAQVLPLEKKFELSESPSVIIVCGVNGSGKTTTIGKLAKFFQNQSKSVLLAAGDTFRAAAADQLNVWARSNQVNMVHQEKGEPASIVYDAIQSAKAKNMDVVIADTAGRLSTQTHLMAELGKVVRVAEKSLGKPPQEKIIIVDGTMGQNVIRQIETFNEIMKGLSGIIVTKLDGSARGGTITSMSKRFNIPVYFIGTGESIDDLVPFSAKEYVDGLLGTCHQE
ncbi:signal recognition particle-docking protein FtsY [Candidatus Ichthyocystis sparus]|uniref:signal recognition particle-docking protein FtsY n=1 Tax=Candidatus Ichthyocystis sparus TaxID=1561004 RepID=UPI000AB91FED|nr:signal recognition particle-docking protein FtsY [Candidatus Ichthyocystis sparus]